MLSSMTDADHCAQNAVAERVNGILKGEFFIDTNFANIQQARMAIKHAVKIYNYERPHMSLGYSTPFQVYSTSLQSDSLVT